MKGERSSEKNIYAFATSYFSRVSNRIHNIRFSSFLQEVTTITPPHRGYMTFRCVAHSIHTYNVRQEVNSLDKVLSEDGSSFSLPDIPRGLQSGRRVHFCSPNSLSHFPYLFFSESCENPFHNVTFSFLF